MPPKYYNNYEDWIQYVNARLDEHEHYIKSRERDLEMANIRLQRLLDATLQRLGESESALLPQSESDTQGTVRTVDGLTQSSSSARTSG